MSTGKHRKRGDADGLEFSQYMEILVVHDKYLVEQLYIKSLRTLKSNNYKVKLKIRKVNENWSMLVINYNINEQVGLVEIIGLSLELERINYIDLRDIENKIAIRDRAYSYNLDMRGNKTRFCLSNGRISIAK